jgi:hypothetical protein
MAQNAWTSAWIRLAYPLLHSWLMPWLRLVPYATAAAVLLSPAPALAQTVTPESANPVRLLNGTPAPLRPPVLDPNGINFADCTNDITLQFVVSTASFSSGQLLQVWAAPSDIQCAVDSTRLGTPATCRSVATQVANLGTAPTTVTVEISAVALVGSCTSQTSSAKVPMTIWFLPTDSTGHLVGNSTVYEYTIDTDLVGPAPPSMPSQLAVGDGFLTVSWVPSTDPDTFGYNIYLDPPPGTTPPPAPQCEEGGTTGACLNGTKGIICDTSVLGAAPIVPDAGTPETSVPETGTPETGTPESGTPTAVDAGNEDAGATGTTGTGDDDAGEGGSTSPGGGISTIPSKYLVSPSIPSGITIPTPTTATYQLSGLQNGAIYNVAVAGVDGLGNIGPASGVECNYPAPILDFYGTYGTDGGRGSGCELESTSLPGGAACTALAAFAALGIFRRRRRIKEQASRTERTHERAP